MGTDEWIKCCCSFEELQLCCVIVCVCKHVKIDVYAFAATLWAASTEVSHFMWGFITANNLSYQLGWTSLQKCFFINVNRGDYEHGNWSVLCSNVFEKENITTTCSLLPVIASIIMNIKHNISSLIILIQNCSVAWQSLCIYFSFYTILSLFCIVV